MTRNKVKIFVWRSGKEQFDLSIEERKWCEQYQDYFEVIDDGNEPLINSPFKVSSLPLLPIENSRATEAKGLLSIVNNIDSLDYDYIGFLHMDFFPMCFNENTLSTYNCYPVKRGQLFNFQTVLDLIENEEKEMLFAFQLLNLYSVLYCQARDWRFKIDGKDMWQFLTERFEMIDIHKMNKEQLFHTPVAICNTVLAKKDYWRTYKVYLDCLDQFYNAEQYHTVEAMQKKERLLGHLLEAFTEMNVIKYIEQHKDVVLEYIPVCHLNH